MVAMAPWTITPSKIWRNDNMSQWLKVVRIDKTLPLPKYETTGAAGIDLYAAEDAEVEFDVVMPTGVAVSIPAGYVGLIRGRSGLAFKKELEPFHGTIDSDYRGEILVKLRNYGLDWVDIKKGDRIAQLIVIPCTQLIVCEEFDLDDTERGENGFGSTGE